MMDKFKNCKLNTFNIKFFHFIFAFVLLISGFTFTKSVNAADSDIMIKNFHFEFTDINGKSVSTTNSDSKVKILIFSNLANSYTYSTLKDISASSWVSDPDIEVMFIEDGEADDESLKTFVEDCCCDDITVCSEKNCTNSTASSIMLKYALSHYSCDSVFPSPTVVLIDENDYIRNFLFKTQRANEIMRACGLFCDLTDQGYPLENMTIVAACGQTEARSMLKEMNARRTGSNGVTPWCWNEDNTEKTTYDGLEELIYDYGLEKAAMQRAAELALMFSHERPTGKSCFTAYKEITETGYATGENIAYGQRSAEEVLNAWWEENENYDGQGHRRNILRASNRYIGIGHVRINGRDFWTQEFASTGSNTEPTEANDSITSFNINFYRNDIQDDYFDIASTTIEIKPGKAVELPCFTEKALHTTTYVPVVNTNEWTIKDSSIAEINGNMIVAKAEGETTLSRDAAYGSEPLTISIVVSDSFDEDIAEENHSWCEEYTIDKEATCTDTGIASIHCSCCYAVKEGSAKVLDAKGHSWNEEYTIDKKATCIDDGSESIHCSRCDAIKEGSARTIAKKNHVFYTWRTISKATCTETGSKERICKNCGYKETETIPANGHSWNEDVTIDKPATCTEDGVQSIHCNICYDRKDVSVIPATGHVEETPVTENIMEAGCVTPGSYDEVIYCSVCGDEISRETIITAEAKGHKDGFKLMENYVERTCETPGSYDEITYCSVCWDIISRKTITLEATGHYPDDPEIENEIEPTYFRDGSYDSVIYCFDCEKELSRETIIVPKLESKKQNISLAKSSYSFTFNSAKSQSQTLYVYNAYGPLSYSSGNSKVYVKDGKIYVSKSAPVGTYNIKVKAAATDDNEYKESNTVTITVKVGKAANTMKAAPATTKLKAAKLKKKAHSFTIKVSQAQGKITYKSSNKKIKVTANGKVTVKKGTKKGKYKVSVTAAGNQSYKKGVKTITIVVK